MTRLIGLLKAHQTREQQEKQELELIIQQFQRQVQLTDAKLRGLEVEKQKLQLQASQAQAQGGGSGGNFLGGGANARSSTPPFFWVPSADYVQEFDVNGRYGEVVTKVRDFEDQGWVRLYVNQILK